MTHHELTVRANRFLICGGTLSDAQKNYIVGRLYEARSPQPVNGSPMYPFYFVPPYNGGRKLRTILGQLPKTQILSANAYELEILRLLFLFVPKDGNVRSMIEGTLERLKRTCFGMQDDGVGECFDASLVVLRFLCTVSPDETEWIKSRIENYLNHAGEKKRTSQAVWYYRLCLSEAPYQTALPYITKCRNELDEFASAGTDKLCDIYLAVIRKLRETTEYNK